jgi:hypothetical protein
MTPRDLARALGFSRIAFGAGLLVAPRASAGLFLGVDGMTPGATVISRAAGIRDAILGGMILHTVDHPQVGRRWLFACAACDLVDGLAAVAARDGLPRVRGAAFAALGLSAAVMHAAVAQQLTSPGGLESVAAQSPPAPASSPDVVMPDGADEAKHAMGARTVGVDTASAGGGVGSGTGPGSDGGTTGGLQA